MKKVSVTISHEDKVWTGYETLATDKEVEQLEEIIESTVKNSETFKLLGEDGISTHFFPGDLVRQCVFTINIKE